MDSTRDRHSAGYAPTRVLIAPDKFKGSLSAREVAEAVADGIRSCVRDVEIDICPVADGGDGTLEAAVSAGFRPVSVEVEGPTGQILTASYGERDGVALVELAEAVGIRRLDSNSLAPMTASTYGAGQLVDAAIRAGNQTIVLAIGGSASSDGGAGLVQALGAEVLDINGRPLERGGAALANVGQIDLRRMHSRLRGIKIVIATDVTSPLLGPNGAAAVFGPQKGASPNEINELERGLAKWAAVVWQSTGVDAAELPGAGAAGGVGFGAVALLSASIVMGADMVLEMVNFAERLAGSSLVVTGEGSLDRQTLFGKAPVKVAQKSHDAGVPAVAVVGRCSLAQEDLASIGIRRVYALQTLEPDLARSISYAKPLLNQIGAMMAEVELEVESRICS